MVAFPQLSLLLLLLLTLIGLSIARGDEDDVSFTIDVAEMPLQSCLPHTP
jgi:hypothetical protein